VNKGGLVLLLGAGALYYYFNKQSTAVAAGTAPTAATTPSASATLVPPGAVAAPVADPTAGWYQGGNAPSLLQTAIKDPLYNAITGNQITGDPYADLRTAFSNVGVDPGAVGGGGGGGGSPSFSFGPYDPSIFAVGRHGVAGLSGIQKRAFAQRWLARRRR